MILMAGISDVYFNPRPRVGGDSGLAAKRSALNYFNPRPRVGGDGGTSGWFGST